MKDMRNLNESNARIRTEPDVLQNFAVKNSSERNDVRTVKRQAHFAAGKEKMHPRRLSLAGIMLDNDQDGAARNRRANISSSSRLRSETAQ